MGEEACNQTLRAQCEKHYESVMSKQEQSKEKGY